jgi:hypothetical protein
MPIPWTRYRSELEEARNPVVSSDDSPVFEMSDGRSYHLIDGELWYLPRNQFEELEKWEPHKFNRRQRRMFMRINSGIQNGIAKKERLIFLTLTTKYDKTTLGQKEDYQHSINKPFTLLKQKIERYLRRKMYISYCVRHDLMPFSKTWRSKEKINYLKIWQKCKFKMKYFKVKTSEGGGVLHIIFRKSYGVPKIPQGWLSLQWAKLWHDSWNVSIRQIKYADAAKTSAYIIRGYIQNQPIIRISYGQQWVYQGFRKSFTHLIEVYGFKRAVEIWKKNMANDVMPTKAGTYQTRFRYRKAQNKTYNKRFFDLTGYSPAKIQIEERHVLTRYPDRCYAWEYEGEVTAKLQGGKFAKIQYQKVKGRLLGFPKEKVNLSRVFSAKLTEQSTLFPFC